MMNRPTAWGILRRTVSTTATPANTRAANRNSASTIVLRSVLRLMRLGVREQSGAGAEHRRVASCRRSWRPDPGSRDRPSGPGCRRRSRAPARRRRGRPAHRRSARRGSACGRRTRRASRPRTASRRRTAAAGRTPCATARRRVIGSRIQAMNVDHAMSVVKPASRPARSEMKNHSCSFSHSKKRRQDRHREVARCPSLMDGDWVMVPSPWPTKISLDRNRRHAGRDEVDGDARHDLVDAEGDRGDGVDARRRACRRRPRRPAPYHGPELPAGVAGEPGAHDHHALEADVHDAGPLGEEAAEAGEEDRCRQADGRDEGGRRRSAWAASVTMRTKENSASATQPMSSGRRPRRRAIGPRRTCAPGRSAR